MTPVPSGTRKVYQWGMPSARANEDAVRGNNKDGVDEGEKRPGYKHGRPHSIRGKGGVSI